MSERQQSRRKKICTHIHTLTHTLERWSICSLRTPLCECKSSRTVWHYALRRFALLSCFFKQVSSLSLKRSFCALATHNTASIASTSLSQFWHTPYTGPSKTKLWQPLTVRYAKLRQLTVKLLMLKYTYLMDMRERKMDAMIGKCPVMWHDLSFIIFTQRICFQAKQSGLNWTNISFSLSLQCNSVSRSNMFIEKPCIFSMWNLINMLWINTLTSAVLVLINETMSSSSIFNVSIKVSLFFKCFAHFAIWNK